MDEIVKCDVENGFLTIRALSFFGPVIASPNKKYLLAWQDAHNESGRGGMRDSGHGQYVLLQDGSLKLQNRLERPNDGKVADNGNFVLSDWLFGEGLKSKFYAFNIAGETLAEISLKANMRDTWISQEGDFACCHTAISDDEEDSSALCWFDLRTGLLIFKKAWDWQPKTFEVDLQRRVLYLHFAGGEKIGIDESGTVLEKGKWLEMQIKAFPPNAILSVVSQEIGEEEDKAIVIEKLNLFAGILERLSNANVEKQCARLAKIVGEMHERFGHQGEAVLFYDKALKLDPKIGLKKRLEDLKKKARTQ